MTFMQAYYTSCVTGMRGSKGFQFNAATPGLDPRLLDQLERLGMYAPPSSAAVQPSAEELARFPLVLLYQPLGNGQSVVAQSRYIGLDYSGRWGNYFTHYALTEDAERDLSGQLPIELWKSPAWVTAESAQQELPRLDEFPLSGVIDAEEIRSFVSERREHIAGIVEATRLALKTGRRVVIVDEDERIAKWIAAATYALPRHLALATSFTTYTKSPYESGAIIIGTSGDGDFRGTQFEIDHQYSVFDFIHGRFSRIEVSSRFAKGVAAAWTQSADRVANFAAFARLVDAGVDAADVDQSWFGYSLTDGILEDAVTPADITWLTGRLERFTAEQLKRVLSSVIGNGELRLDLAEPLFQLYDRARRSTVAAAVEEQIAPWLALVAIADADHNAERIATLAPHSENVRQRVAPYAAKWVEAIQSAPSAARCAALLVSGEALGFALADPHRTGAAAARWITDSSVQTRLLGLARKTRGGEMVAAIVAALRALPQAAFSLDRIDAFLRDDEVRKATRAVVAESEDIAFYARVLTVLEREPFTAFTTAVMAAKQLDGSVTASRVDEVCEVVWRGTTPPARDVLRISENYPALLPETKLFSALPRVLYLADTTPDEAEQLTAVLAKTENRSALGNRFYPVAVYQARRALLHVNVTEPYRPIEKAISLLGKWHFDAGAAAWLEDAIAIHLIGIADPRAHARYLSRAIAAHHELLTYYQRRAAERLRTSAAQVSTASKFFQVWQLEGERGDWLLSEVLAAELRGWPRKRIDELGYELARVDESTAAAWSAWRTVTSEKKSSFFGRLFRKRSTPGGTP